MRGEVEGWGGVGKVTEMLKDERGGGEITQIEGAGYTEEQRYRGKHRADKFMPSSSRTFLYVSPALFVPSLPLCSCQINAETL